MLGRIRSGGKVEVAARERPGGSLHRSCGWTKCLVVSIVDVMLFGIKLRAQMRVQDKHNLEEFERARAHDWI